MSKGNDERGHGPPKIEDHNCGAFDHASRTPQLMHNTCIINIRLQILYNLYLWSLEIEREKGRESILLHYHCYSYLLVKLMHPPNANKLSSFSCIYKCQLTSRTQPLSSLICLPCNTAWWFHGFFGHAGCGAFNYSV